MKKKIFGGIAIVTIAVAIAFNVTVSNQKTNKASLLALANVEALAQSEANNNGVICHGAGAYCFTRNGNDIPGTRAQ